MTEDQHMQKAREIVDEACLGEPFAKNGVIAALTDTIAAALSEAYRAGVEEERARCAEELVEWVKRRVQVNEMNGNDQILACAEHLRYALDAILWRSKRRPSGI